MNPILLQLASALEQAAPPDPAHLEHLAVGLWQTTNGEHSAGFDAADRERVVRLYRGLATESGVRPHLLRALAAAGDERALASFVELFIDDPPAHGEAAAMACVPLFQRPTPEVAALFPRLLDALSRPATAALVLDLANHLMRRGVVGEHPARSHRGELIALLGGLVEGLRRLEENPSPAAAGVNQLQRQLAESISLVVPLCEALALIGDPAAIGKLYQALSLSHRRLRVIAARSLARLGERAGRDALRELAAEPVARPLVLESLEELGELESVEPRFRSSAARAEGEMAAWLAHPTRYGMPPAELELIDSANLPWPGYAEPVECFLFHFTYQLPRGEFSGVGIAGPATHALYADLEDLPPEDIYALYAGWSVEHAEITETPAEALTGPEREAWELVSAPWEEQGYTDLQLAKLGHFLGEETWVATADKGGRKGVLIGGDGTPHWFPILPNSRPLGPTELYWLFIGRRMLQAFRSS